MLTSTMHPVAVNFCLFFKESYRLTRFTAKEVIQSRRERWLN